MVGIMVVDHYSVMMVIVDVRAVLFSLFVVWWKGMKRLL